MTFRPLLAATIESNLDLEKLSFPMIASPKLDGIRVLIHPTLGPITRKLKPIPNIPTLNYLNKPEFHFLDGEIIVGNNFSNTTSAIMAHGGIPNFTYYIFDNFKTPNFPYMDRLKNLISNDPKVKILEWIEVKSINDLQEAEARYLTAGHEGIMLRKPLGIYKFNRSTFNEQILLKLKRFTDSEAEIVGFEELYKNDNKLEANNLGYAERSSNQEGLTPMNTLGALLVRSLDFDVQFKIGSGYDQTTRKDIWFRRNELIGKIIKFKYQNIGIKDRPRFPIFLGFRED